MKKYENFCRALNNLKEIDEYEEPYGNVIMTGLVAYMRFASSSHGS